MADLPLTMFRADLHIHTCLSPCGDWDMTPRFVVEQSQKKKLNLIAVTDHNSVENAGAAMACGKEMGVTVFPGMEICTLEEVHVLALFDDLKQAEAMQAYVYENLDGENNPDIFGYQVVANEQDEVEDQNPRMLIGATRIDLNTLVSKIHDMGGLAIAAHIDKTAYSLLAQLGFLPPDLPLDAVEVSFRAKPDEASQALLMGAKIPCITSSDAHFPGEIGRVSTKFYLAEPTIVEMKKALEGKDGRIIMHSKKAGT